MPCHIILTTVVVDDGWLGFVLFLYVLYWVIQLVRPVWKFLNAKMHGCFHLRILSQCPVVLIPHIRPSYLLIKVIRFLLFNLLSPNIHLALIQIILLLFLLLLLSLYLSCWLILLFLGRLVQLLSAVQIGSVRPSPEMVETEISDFHNFRIGSKVFDVVCPLRKR